MLGELPIEGIKDEVLKMVNTLKKTQCADLNGCYSAKSGQLQLYFFKSNTAQQTFLLVINTKLTLPKLLKDNVQKILGGTSLSDPIISISTADFELDTAKMPADLQNIVRDSYFNVNAITFSSGVQISGRADLGGVMETTMKAMGVDVDKLTLRAAVVMPIPTDLTSGAGTGAGLADSLSHSETMKKSGAKALSPEAFVEFQLAPGSTVSMNAPLMTLTDSTFFINNAGTFGYKGNARFKGTKKDILLQFQTPLDPAGAMDLLDFSFRMAMPQSFTLEDHANMTVGMAMSGSGVSTLNPAATASLNKYGGGFVGEINAIKKPLLAVAKPLSVFQLRNPNPPAPYKFGDRSKPFPTTDVPFNVILLGPLADGGPLMYVASDVQILGQTMGKMEVSAGKKGFHGMAEADIVLKLGPLGKTSVKMQALADITGKQQDISLKGNLMGQKLAIILQGEKLTIDLSASCVNPFEIKVQVAIEESMDIAKIFQGEAGANVDPSKLQNCMGKELEAAYNKIAGDFKELGGYTAKEANAALKKIDDAAKQAAAETARAAEKAAADAQKTAQQATAAANKAAEDLKAVADKATNEAKAATDAAQATADQAAKAATAAVEKSKVAEKSAAAAVEVASKSTAVVNQAAENSKAVADKATKEAKAATDAAQEAANQAANAATAAADNAKAASEKITKAADVAKNRADEVVKEASRFNTEVVKKWTSLGVNDAGDDLRGALRNVNKQVNKTTCRLSGNCKKKKKYSEVCLAVLDEEFYTRKYGEQVAGIEVWHWAESSTCKQASKQGSAEFEVNYYYFNNGKRYGFNNTWEYETLTKHWLDHGRHDGVRGSADFSIEDYREQNPGLWENTGNNWLGLWDHWLKSGINEGRAINAEFKATEYLANYADLRALLGDTNYPAAFDHWVIKGKEEGRKGRTDQAAITQAVADAQAVSDAQAAADTAKASATTAQAAADKAAADAKTVADKAAADAKTATGNATTAANQAAITQAAADAKAVTDAQAAADTAKASATTAQNAADKAAADVKTVADKAAANAKTATDNATKVADKAAADAKVAAETAQKLMYTAAWQSIDVFSAPEYYEINKARYGFANPSDYAGLTKHWLEVGRIDVVKGNHLFDIQEYNGKNPGLWATVTPIGTWEGMWRHWAEARKMATSK